MAIEFEVEYNLHYPAWRSVVDGFWNTASQQLLQQAWELNLSRLKSGTQQPSTVTVSVLLTDDEEISHLNQQYRQQPRATNILSFPMSSFAAITVDLTADLLDAANTLVLGDLVLAYQTCQAQLSQPEFYDLLQGPSQFSPLQLYSLRLLAHGILHLFGYDHLQEAEAERMEALEAQLLANLGIILESIC